MFFVLCSTCPTVAVALLNSANGVRPIACEAMTSDTPLQAIQGAERFIRGQVALGLGTLKAACAAQLPNLLELLRAASREQSAVTEALEYLTDETCCFSAEDRATIGAQLVATTQSRTSRGSDTTGDNQSNLYLYDYYPDQLWAIFRADDSIDNKLRHQADFWVKHLGLLKPSEKTKRLGVAIVHEASSRPIDPEDGYNHLHDLAGFVVAKRSSHKCQMTLSNFPKDPRKFMAQFPGAYSACHPPIPCRINVDAVKERCTTANIPARSTAKQLRRARTLSPGATHRPRSDTTGPQDFMSAAEAIGNYLKGHIQASHLPSRFDMRDDARLRAPWSRPPPPDDAADEDSPSFGPGLTPCLDAPPLHGELPVAKLRTEIEAGLSSTTVTTPKKKKTKKPKTDMTPKKKTRLTKKTAPDPGAAPASMAAWVERIPAFTMKPVAYGGGKVVYDTTRKRLRVFRRSSDCVPRIVMIDVEDKENIDKSWNQAFDIINADQRPR